MEKSQTPINAQRNLSDRVKSLRESDPAFDELISDYDALLREAKAADDCAYVDNSRFLEDAKSSLQALDLEISERVSRAENAEKIERENQ